MAIQLEIVTPEKRAYNDTVESVLLPTADGQIDVLEGHVPIITVLNAGGLEIVKDGKQDFLAIDKGYAQVIGDKVSVLTEAAIDVEEIDLEATEKARKEAEQALKDAEQNKEIDPGEMERLEAQVRFAIAKELTKKHQPGR